MAGKCSKDEIIRIADFRAHGQVAVDPEINDLAERFQSRAHLIRVKAARASIVVVSVYAVDAISP